MLVAARELTAAAGVDTLVEASGRVSGTGHPAVLALRPPPAPSPPWPFGRTAGRSCWQSRPGEPRWR
ncbi:MAG: hypothetical protein LC796_06860 [Acidobacteria bacterium]|nr:hypothetical protein [Acidobacteriota bacterium]